jgi:hypothetical protein
MRVEMPGQSPEEPAPEELLVELYEESVKIWSGVHCLPLV